MFKDKLKELREKEGLSQQELADKLFVSRSAVAKWENGNGIPSDVNLDSICKFFDIDKKHLKLKKEDFSYLKNKKISFMILLTSLLVADLIFLIVGTVTLVNKHKEKQQYYNDIIFYENSIIIENTENFKINDEHLTLLYDRFDYVNKDGQDFFYVNANNPNDDVKYPIEIHYASSSFINTGVIVEDSNNERFFYHELQNVNLLYGDVFNDESTSYEIVIDSDTSILYFGKENSVGKILSTKIGDFKVIGVVSNTIEREVFKKANGYKGEEWLYPTQAYVSHALAIKLSEEYDEKFNWDYQKIIVSDDDKSAEEIKHIVEILFNIPEDDQFTITTREQLLDLYTYEINVKTNILYVVSSALILLALIGGIFIFKVIKEYKKLNVTK